MITSRRRVLGQALAAVGLAGQARSSPAWTRDDLFSLGVASGEPTPDGMVLWTRLAPRPQEVGGGMPSTPVAVTWVVAEDEHLHRVVAAGEATAFAGSAHTVHVEVSGLRPHRPYWYRFRAGGQASAIGRTATAPAPGANVSALRVAFGSCQRYDAGYYAAHRDIARAAPDLVVFLGDYIYEKRLKLGSVRPHPLFEARDLDTYRQRYALYKSDPDLQAAHAAAPWMVIWDDHEVENDYGGDQNRTASVATFLRRRAAAYQAFYEHMPLRRASMVGGGGLRLFRTLDWGSLAQFQFLDTRQYRPHRTCDQEARGRQIPATCAQRFDPSRSMLGAPQERWLQGAFRATRARWNILTQPYLMSPLRDAEGQVSNDCWDGYPVTRQRILRGWQDAAVSNPVVLGGDIHTFVAADLAVSPGGRPIASEFVGGSITSHARADAIPPAAHTANPLLRFADGTQRGYGLMTLRPGECSVAFRGVEDATRLRAPVRTLARFAVEHRRPGLHRA